MSHNFPRSIPRVLGILVFIACSHDSPVEQPPPEGATLELTTVSTGTLLDPDGYIVTVDGGEWQPVDVNGTRAIAGLAAGDRSVRLSDVAANCLVGGENPRRVTVDTAAPAQTVFDVTCSASESPRIAFSSQGSQTGIQVMNADGSGRELVTHAGSMAHDPQWAPDASKIAFVDAGDIYLVRLDGTGETRLTNDPETDELPSWSPSVRQIAWLRRTSDGSDRRRLYVMNADGSGQGPRTEPGYTNYSRPVWSPASGKIAFEFKGSINLINADGTGRTTLASSAPARAPSWSPDGEQIAFVGSIYPQPYPLEDIFVMNADGSGEANLTPSFGGVWGQPVWSHDGRRLAAAKGNGRMGFPKIFFINADGSGQTALGLSEYETDPAWSPDDTRIAFANRDGFGNFSIIISRPDGTEAVNLFGNPPDGGVSPAWSPR